LLTALLVTLAIFVGLFGYLEYSVYREVTTETDVLNADGAKTALVYYHPGLSDFAHNVTYTYAEALAAVGWRVEIATVNPQAPTDLSKYSLLALTWAIYDFSPAPTITNQLHRIGNLNGIDTVIITIGGGIDPLNANAAMNKIVGDANGNVVQSLTLFRSNRDFTGLQQQAQLLTP
jgi:hypothetical protein